MLRYTNNVAGKACHVVGYATQVGLTQALALIGESIVLYRSTISLVLLAASTGACTQQSAADFKKQYRSKVLSSCTNKTSAQGKLTVELRDAYCLCSADTIISSHTVAELKVLDTFPSDPALEGKVKEIMLKCARQAAER
ncbi:MULTISPECIES: hypothetical protein [unclassified Lysobacter]